MSAKTERKEIIKQIKNLSEQLDNYAGDDINLVLAVEDEEKTTILMRGSRVFLTAVPTELVMEMAVKLTPIGRVLNKIMEGPDDPQS